VKPSPRFYQHLAVTQPGELDDAACQAKEREARRRHFALLPGEAPPGTGEKVRHLHRDRGEHIREDRRMPGLTQCLIVLLDEPPRIAVTREQALVRQSGAPSNTHAAVFVLPAMSLLVSDPVSETCSMIRR
jgi:hypothetical protein